MDCVNAQVRVKKLNPRAKLPVYASEGSAGCDVSALLESDIILSPGSRVLIPTGLAFSIPPGFEIQVRPRSGLALRHGISLVNSPGTIDQDYRGELSIILINHGQEAFVLHDGDRIAQLILAPVSRASFKEEKDLDSTSRGSGGFGSTGIEGT